MGITGIDVALTDIAEDTSYFSNSENLYAFLVDETGNMYFLSSFSYLKIYVWQMNMYFLSPFSYFKIIYVWHRKGISKQTFCFLFHNPLPFIDELGKETNS